ncbi:MAG TPA: hypothetical protein VIM18_03125, partial [Solirubrobacteraceae bacterium]
ELLAGFPGECDVLVELRTSVGDRRLRLGSDFRVARSASLHAELQALLGVALIAKATVEVDQAAGAEDEADPDEPEVAPPNDAAAAEPARAVG